MYRHTYAQKQILSVVWYSTLRMYNIAIKKLLTISDSGYTKQPLLNYVVYTASNLRLSPKTTYLTHASTSIHIHYSHM